MIIKMLVLLLFIVFTSCKGAEVGMSVYSFNHPPFNEHDDISAAAARSQEVRKAKSISFSDDVTTYRPKFRKPNGDVAADITTVSSDTDEDTPTKYRVIPGGYRDGQVPVAVVYETTEGAILERKRVVQRRRKPIPKDIIKPEIRDSEENTEYLETKIAGKRKLAYKTIRRNKNVDVEVTAMVQEGTLSVDSENNANSIEKLEEPTSLRNSIPVIQTKKVKEIQETTPSVVSKTEQIIEGKSNVKEVKLSSRRELIQNKNIFRSSFKNTNENEKESVQSTTSSTRTIIDKNPVDKPLNRRPTNQVSRIINDNTEANYNKKIQEIGSIAEKGQNREETRGREKKPIVPILESESYLYAHNGDFHYSYEGGDGTKAFEKGILKTSSLKNSDEEEEKGEAVEGGFSYKDKEGNDYSLTYTADENGYRPVGAHLPTPPPIPPAIARALAYLATKPTPIDGEVTKSWW